MSELSLVADREIDIKRPDDSDCAFGFALFFVARCDVDFYLFVCRSFWTFIALVEPLSVELDSHNLYVYERQIEPIRTNSKWRVSKRERLRINQVRPIITVEVIIGVALNSQVSNRASGALACLIVAGSAPSQ